MLDCDKEIYRARVYGLLDAVYIGTCKNLRVLHEEQAPLC